MILLRSVEACRSWPWPQAFPYAVPVIASPEHVTITRDFLLYAPCTCEN